MRTRSPQVNSDASAAPAVAAVPMIVPVCDVICAADEAYALPLAVMLQSLLANVDRRARVVVHIVDCGLSAESRAAIDSLAGGKATIHWRRSIRSREFADPRWGHVTGATYERLLLVDYLPDDLQRVLWLDADLLVLGDVTPLLQAELGVGLLGAVQDPFVPRVSAAFGIRDWHRLGLARNAPYFNAGVMMIDLQRWRDRGVAERALAYLRKYGRAVYFNEQEALNAVIGGSWTPLDDRWNISANPMHARVQRPGGEGPAIVHFAGRVKPWAVPDLGGFQDLYYHHMDNTPWRHQRPRRTAAKRLLSWYLRSPLRRRTYWLENQHLRLRHFWGF